MPRLTMRINCLNLLRWTAMLIAIQAMSATWAGAEEKTAKVEAGDITLTVPETWKKMPPKPFRLVEFSVPSIEGVEGTGEYVVFHFGPGQGGNVKENIDRWVGQFDAEGRTVKTVTGKSEQGEYTLVDITGTYKKTVGPPIQRQTKSLPGWRVQNVFLNHDKGSYFLKLDGPANLVKVKEEQFRASFGGKKADEKEAKVEKAE